MDKNLIYTKHAEERLRMRNIRKELVENVIDNPDKVIKKESVTISQKVLDEKMIRVVYKQVENAYIVITAYLTIKKRYREGSDKK